MSTRSQSHHGQTPLLRATERGHEGVVLLGGGMPSGVRRQTLTSCAWDSGHEGVAELLGLRGDPVTSTV